MAESCSLIQLLRTALFISTLLVTRCSHGTVKARSLSVFGCVRRWFAMTQDGAWVVVAGAGNHKMSRRCEISRGVAVSTPLHSDFTASSRALFVSSDTAPAFSRLGTFILRAISLPSSESIPSSRLLIRASQSAYLSASARYKTSYLRQSFVPSADSLKACSQSPTQPLLQQAHNRLRFNRR